jgi:hypothetical protein
MRNPFLIFVCILFLACSDKKSQSINKAIRLKESSKGHSLESYSILRSVDTLGVFKVYYEARLSPGSQLTTVRDSISFYELGDGQLEPEP